jgi:hypothetical protein
LQRASTSSYSDADSDTDPYNDPYPDADFNAGT